MISSLEVAATKEADTDAKANINDIEQKTETRQPPLPFNLSKLQIEASKRWGYKPKVALDVTCTGRCYRATQTTLNKQGWEVLFKGEHQDEPNQNALDLASLTKGIEGTCTQVDMDQRETKPPKYFDDASLLKAMTQAAKFIKDPELRKTLEAKDKDTAGENGSIGINWHRSHAKRSHREGRQADAPSEFR